MNNILSILKGFIGNKHKEKIAVDDGRVMIRERAVLEPSDFTCQVRTVLFNIELVETGEIIGRCELRLGMNDELYYLGQVGYNVRPRYRGHHYAYYATRLLFRVARENFGMNELYITCSPDNIPSYKTLMKLEGELLETADVPASHFLYEQDEKVKCIFRYDL